MTSEFEASCLTARKLSAFPQEILAVLLSSFKLSSRSNKQDSGFRTQATRDLHEGTILLGLKSNDSTHCIVGLDWLGEPQYRPHTNPLTVGRGCKPVWNKIDKQYWANDKKYNAISNPVTCDNARNDSWIFFKHNYPQVELWSKSKHFDDIGLAEAFCQPKNSPSTGNINV